MLKILHLISGLDRGGIERWLLGVLPHLDLKRHRIDFLSRLPSETALDQQFIDLGSRVYLNAGSRFNFVSYCHQLARLIKDEKYDIIHNHLAHHGGIPARTYSRLGVPSVVSFHNAKLGALQFGNPFKRWISSTYSKRGLNYMIENSRIVTGCSDDVLSELGQVISFDNAETCVLHYGVDIPERLPPQEIAEVKRSIGIAADKKIVVHVGSFTRQKNHFMLLQIAQQVLEKRADVVFVLVGDGRLKADVERFALELGLRGSVKFLGLRNDIERILSSADVFLFPSLFEGLPVACLEALAAGLPVVGSNVPGTKLLVISNQTGFLCDKDDTPAFARKINLLLDDHRLRNDLGEQARDFVRNEFSYDASAVHLMELYQTLNRRCTTDK